MMAGLAALLAGCATYEPPAIRYFSYDMGEAKRSVFDSGLITVQKLATGCRISVGGPISADMPRAFGLAADDAGRRGCQSTSVVLNSNGGDVAAAISIGKSVRSHGYDTTIGRRCESSCGLIFISGVKRLVAGAAIGLHRLARKAADGKKTCEDPDSRASQAYLAFAKGMLPPEAAEHFYRIAMETECTKLSFVSPEELVSSGIATGMGSTTN
jgi:hypothetical protein